ncbi:DUF4349 domain-containing protein [archaeon]|nr:DUF4349 domain-containing protein [archaeon]NCP79211.1 DUF4349 domain-containing protein [archaeon]NCP97842.1 DUF4349 domain-containing protein [archaeon]NCQ06978.1 DUF4349 domain-containing protein [archaeon]NCQ50774.1 DUF4349 domain-containing protein [archaeon]
MSFKEQLIRLKENWLIILLVVVAFLVLTFLVSNGTSYSARDSFAMNDSAMYSKSMEYAGGYGLSYSQDFAPEVEDRKITKNSSLSLEVKGGEFKLADSKVKSIVSSSDSIVLNESLNTRENGNKEEYYGSYSIKVESSKLDSVVSQLREIGKVTYFTENSNDITGSYTNREIELEVERERLLRYQEMYNSAEKISDKIELNDRIFNQERTIKYLEDSLKNMDQRVDYSTINLNISEKYSYSNIALVKLSDLVRSFVNSVNALLKFLFVIIPFAFLGWIVYLVSRNKKNSKKR